MRKYRVQPQIELAVLDVLVVLIVFAVFHAQLGRQHFGDPEAAADPEDAAMELVAVGEKEGLGLDDGQHIGEKGGQIIAEAQPPGFPAKAGELPGPLGLFGAALSPGARKAPGGHLGPHLLADILQFIEQLNVLGRLLQGLGKFLIGRPPIAPGPGLAGPGHLRRLGRRV